MQAATYLPARKGGRHLKDENNMTYALNKRRDNKTYYVCTEKKRLNCPATAVVENMREELRRLVGNFYSVSTKVYMASLIDFFNS